MNIKNMKLRVKNKSKVIKLIIWILIIIALAFFIWHYFYKSKAKKVASVTLTTAAKKDLTQSVSETGNISADSKCEVPLSTTQKIVQVFVSEGQTVKKGDILAKYDPSDYECQLAKANITLQTANDDLSQLLSGGSVSDRETLINKVSQDQIKIQKDQITYNSDNGKLSQNESLYKNGYMSQSDYNDSKTTVQNDANQISADKSQLDADQKSLSDFDVTNQQSVEKKKQEIESDEQDVVNYTNKIEQCNIRSTVDGKVVKFDAKENQNPKSGDEIIVEDPSSFVVSVNYSQYDAVNVKLGDKANIKVKGVDKPYEGIVTYIANSATIVTSDSEQESKVNIKVKIDNPDSNISDGYEADTEIILNEKENVLALNFEALKQNKDGTKYVFVVQGNRAIKKEIKTGLESDTDVEVTSGLNEKDKCILNPSDTLKNGQIVGGAGISNGNSSNRKGIGIPFGGRMK